MALAMKMTLVINPSTPLGYTRFPSKIHSNGSRNGKKLKVTASSGVVPTSSREAILARDDLLNLIAGEERGLRTQKNPSKCSQIIKAIDALAVFGADTVSTDSSLSGTWRMVWTTEKEQLFIVENAHLFGTQVGDILQVIDVDRGTLNNVITFPPSGAFVVASTIQVVSSQRVNFREICLQRTQNKATREIRTSTRFTSAILQVANWKIPLPPFGQGCQGHDSTKFSRFYSPFPTTLSEDKVYFYTKV